MTHVVERRRIRLPTHLVHIEEMQAAAFPFRIIVVTARPEVEAFVRVSTAKVAQVRQVRLPAELTALLQIWPADIVIVDAAAGTGTSSVTRIRGVVALPLLALTVGKNAVALVEALDAGADDVVTLPADRAELRARLRALLRRHSVAPRRAQVEFGSFVIDPEARTAQLDALDLALTPIEFTLLHLLVAARGEVVGKDRIRMALWGESARDSNVIEQHVRRLRKKVGDSNAGRSHIGTRGLGYFIVGSVDSS